MGISPDHNLSKSLLNRLTTKEKTDLMLLILDNDFLVHFKHSYMFDFFLYFLEDLKSSGVANDEYVLIYSSIDLDVAIEKYFAHAVYYEGGKIDVETILSIVKDFYDQILKSEIYVEFKPQQGIVAYSEKCRARSETNE